MGLFLPFSEKGKEIESRAIEVKAKLGLGAYDPVDPVAVLRQVPARVLDREEVMRFPEEMKIALFQTHSSRWSAAGIGRSPATGEELILLNHTHHPNRQRVSLMEEIVHIVMGHPRTSLPIDPDDRWTRPFDETCEDEAFAVGAACMVPYRDLFNAINERGPSARELAAPFKVSQSYVEFRIKRAGLWNLFRNRQRSFTSR